MDPEVDVSSRFVYKDALHGSDGFLERTAAWLMVHILRDGVKCGVCSFSVLSGLFEVNVLVVKSSVF